MELTNEREIPWAVVELHLTASVGNRSSTGTCFLLICSRRSWSSDRAPSAGVQPVW